MPLRLIFRLGLILLTVCSAAARSVADETADAAPLPPLLPQPLAQRLGYAFDNPRILTRQRLFGLYHGINVLAAHCPETSAARAAAAAWRQQQHDAIAATLHELAQFHFGAASVDARALAHLFNLPDTPAAAQGSQQLMSACASLPAALRAPRYDLNLLFHQSEASVIVSAAVETNARIAACRPLLSPALAQQLDQKAAQWRSSNDPLRQNAAGYLILHWPDDLPEKTYAAWLAQVQQTQPQVSAQTCADLVATLTEPRLRLDHAFDLPQH